MCVMDVSLESPCELNDSVQMTRWIHWTIEVNVFNVQLTDDSLHLSLTMLLILLKKYLPRAKQLISIFDNYAATVTIQIMHLVIVVNRLIVSIIVAHFLFDTSPRKKNRLSFIFTEFVVLSTIVSCSFHSRFITISSYLKLI